MVSTISQRAARSAGLAAAVAPATARAFAGVRFHTASSCPAAMIRSAKTLPILPSPAIPTRMVQLLPGASARQAEQLHRRAARHRRPVLLAERGADDMVDRVVLGHVVGPVRPEHDVIGAERA